MSNLLSMSNNELSQKIYNIANTKLNESIREIKYLGGGSNGKAFSVKLNEDKIMVIKAYRTVGMNENEANQLKILSANTHVSMPEVIFTYSDDSIALLGMSFIQGSNVLNPSFLFKSKNKAANFACDVAKGMLEWHSIKGNKFGDLDNPQYSSWHEYYRKEKVNEILDGLQKLVVNKSFSRKNYEFLCKATEMYDIYEEEPSNSVLIHGDLNIMNIMANKKDFQLTGFIDPCGSMWADREYDLFQLQNMWGNKFLIYDTYKQMCGGLSKGSDFRVAYYGTMNEFSCRLNGGVIFPLWEDLWLRRLKLQMKNHN